MKISDATILIGDDSILARKQLKDVVISFGGQTIYEAANGNDAVKLAIEHKPDLIFLDIVF